MTPGPIQIPIHDLDEDTVRRLVEEFITREGTDYGRVEVPLNVQIERALRALKAGDVSIMFDPATETTTLIKTEALPPS